MTLKAFAIQLKNDLVKNNNPQDVIYKIMTVRHNDGTYLSMREKEKIISYLEGNEYNRIGRRLITDSDNSAYLNLVNIVAQAIKNNSAH